MLKLYAEHLWDSPFVYTVMVALEEKRIPYALEVLDLSQGRHRAADYASASLTARVPAIELGGFWLSESSAIVEYLEEEQPEPPIFPASRQERARARQILAWLRSDLSALRADRSTESMFYEHARDPLSAAGRADADKLLRVTGEMVGDGRGFIFERFSIADADLCFMLARLKLNGDALPAAVDRYFGGVWQRPSVQKYVTQPRPAR